jgi:hypothetical protein
VVAEKRLVANFNGIGSFFSGGNSRFYDWKEERKIKVTSLKVGTTLAEEQP